MASSAGTPGAAYSYSSRSGSGSGAYTTVAAHHLTRQRSVPAALAAAFAPCAGGGHDWPRSLGDGGGVSHGRAPAARAATGGVAGAVARLVRAWIGSRRRSGKVAVMSRSGSSAKERQQQLYGHEEYVQNFDEGAAAGEPENLARSFSVRYARQAPRDGARR